MITFKNRIHTEKMNSYLTKIDTFINSLDQETLAALNNISTTRSLKKGEFLLRQDEICSKSYFIEEGIVRKYYLDDGKEITTELYFKEDIAVSFNSYCLQTTSNEFIQAVTDITVSQTDFKEFQNAKKQFPKLTELDLMLTEYYAIWLEDRLFQFRTLDATTRYLKLIKEHSHIIKNIQLTHIASYLGISLETLSRIRSKI
ncbi:Crp/Fnr family transcriptional regulator [Flavobacterium sp. B183]|uniref:Crp/Fnr family transcriptional regulator n=1 Tax=Flavobacterium sp. B183 TaxID=907046 RepID=UPI00201EF3CC|nr:Crp/Fnr family transcriptional regulator [Flavobacterium sp. B183]URC12289.1 Crp/Fnr family transcriptional regulator [Flavobacterium sp. B183]